MITSTPASSSSAPLKSPISPHIKDDSEVREARAALTQLQKEFDTYRKERKEHENILLEQLEQKNNQVSEYR